MDIRFARARHSLIAPAALLAVLALGACTTSPQRVVVAAKEMKLTELVNKRVEFTGVVQGPGEYGDFIVISDNRIYLDKLRIGDRNGQRATVTGWLRHFQPPTAADCADGCENADVAEHYWIEDPKFKTSAPAQQGNPTSPPGSQREE